MFASFSTAFDVVFSLAKYQRIIESRGGRSMFEFCVGELANTSSNGYYWSSSPNYGGNHSAGYLHFYSGSVYPLNSNYRAYGFSVRCVRDK